MRTRTYHRTPKDPFVKTQFNYFGASSSTRQKSVKKEPQDRRDNEIPTHNVSAQKTYCIRKQRSIPFRFSVS